MNELVKHHSAEPQMPPHWKNRYVGDVTLGCHESASHHERSASDDNRVIGPAECLRDIDVTPKRRLKQRVDLRQVFRSQMAVEEWQRWLRIMGDSSSVSMVGAELGQHPAKRGFSLEIAPD